MKSPLVYPSSSRLWLVVVIPLLALLFVISATASAQGEGGLETLPAWGQVPSPNTGFHPRNKLEDVKIISPTNVWAVGTWGDYNYPYDLHPNIQHWDGTQWTPATLPDNLPDTEIYSVDASASDNVWVVGHFEAPLVLRYDGAAWTEQPVPMNDYDWVNPSDVVVFSPTDVWITGKAQINYTEQFILLYHWNGTTWTDESIAFTYGAVHDVYASEAISTSNIWVVGDGNSADGLIPYVYHYDGTTWNQVNDPVIDQFMRIQELSTLPSGEVWVVGALEDNQKRVAYFDGSAWSLLSAIPGTGPLNTNIDVEAIATDDVWASGLHHLPGANGGARLWHWDGVTWTMIETESVGDSPRFEGLDANAGALWAVGGRFSQGTLTAQWNGTIFDEIPSANGGTGPNELNDIDGTSDTDFWAVGNAGGQGAAFHWQDGMWMVTQTPPLSNSVTLEGVAVAAANDVWAVGSTLVDGGLDYQTVIYRWDGAAWSRIPSPNPSGDVGDQLHDAVAVSTTDVWAVGGTGNLSENALILHWDGTGWQNVPNSCGYTLLGVTALAANDIWAVGEGTTCHYNGSTWTHFDLPSSIAGANMQGVDGVAANDVWAVGTLIECDPFTCYGRAVSAHWNGTTWSSAFIPGRAMSDVVTLAPDNAYAVGTYSIGTAIAHWNGSEWENVPAPDPEEGGALAGIFDGTPGHLWAVGFYFDDANQKRTFVVNAPSETQGAAFGNIGYGGATVVWLGPVNGSTTSDATGEYAAAGLPAGTYTFIATGDGCDPQQSTVYITAGQFVRQDFDLCGTQPTQVPSPTATIPGATPTATEQPDDPTSTPTEEPTEPTSTEVPGDPTPTEGPGDPTMTPTEGPSEPSPTPTEGPGNPSTTPTSNPEATSTPTQAPGDPTPTATTAPEPPVVFNPPSVNGTQVTGESTEYQVRMTNTGAEPLVWSSYTASTSCYTPNPIAWVSVSPQAGTTPPGTTADVTVTVNTDGLTVGTYSGYVCILDSAGMIKPLSVRMRVMAEGETTLFLPMIQR